MVVDELASGPGYMAVPPAKTTGRNRLYSEWSPVATLEGTVSRITDRKSIFADATGNRTRASGATGGTDDDEGSLV